MTLLKLFNIIFLFLTLPFHMVVAQDLGNNTIQNSDTSREKFYFAAGMGVNLINASEVVDYINSLPGNTQRFDDFATGIEFFGNAGYRFSKDWGVCFAFDYLFKTYEIENSFGNHQNQYSIYMPSILLQRFLVDDVYYFKINAGVGYNYAIFLKTQIGEPTEEYISKGLGFKFGAEANTPFGDNLYGYLGTDFRISIMGNYKSGTDEYLSYPQNGKQVNVGMSFFSLGLKFGLIYYL